MAACPRARGSAPGSERTGGHRTASPGIVTSPTGSPHAGGWSSWTTTRAIPVPSQSRGGGPDWLTFRKSIEGLTVRMVPGDIPWPNVLYVLHEGDHRLQAADSRIEIGPT